MDAGEDIDGMKFEKLGGRMNSLRREVEEVGGDPGRIMQRVKAEITGKPADEKAPPDSQSGDLWEMQNQLKWMKETLKQYDPNSSSAKDLQRKIDILEERIERITGPKIRPPLEGIFRAGLDGKKREARGPLKHRPWKVENVIGYSHEHQARDKDFIERSQAFLQKPTSWLAAELAALPGNNKVQWKLYIVAKWTPVYKKYHKVQALNPAQLGDLQRFADYWFRKLGMISEVKQTLNGFTAKGPLLSWSWVKEIKSFDNLSEEYYDLQDRIRAKLLTEKETTWSPSEANEYNDSLTMLCRHLIMIERQLVWLLGCATSEAEVAEDENALQKQEKLKKEKIAPQQRIVYEAWLDYQLFEIYLLWCVNPGVFGPAAVWMAASKFAVESYRQIVYDEYKKQAGKLDELKMKGGVARAQRIRRGLKRSEKLATFRPHKETKSNRGSFYASCLPWTEYKIMYEKGFFKMAANENETYLELLLDNEEPEFVDQRKKRTEALGIKGQ